ncbi:MAG: DUF2341 domain-containing protein [Patescibacteria group bacterium]
MLERKKKLKLSIAKKRTPTLRDQLRDALIRLQIYRRKYHTQMGISAVLLVGLLVVGTAWLAWGPRLLAAPIQDAVAVSADGEWNSGTLSDITVSSGSIGISGDGGAGWLDPAWSFRQPVTITNNGAVQTNYQVKLTIAYDSGMQADFDDLRFATTGGVQLDYWLQNKTDSTAAVVWVEVGSLAGASDTIIYMYYGNGAASSASNGEATFQLFDDFNDGSIDPAKWDTVNLAGHVSETGGQLVFGPGNGGWTQAMYSDTAFARSDLAFELDYRWNSNNVGWDALMMGWKDNGTGASYSNLVYGYYNNGCNCSTTTITQMAYEDGSGRGPFADTWVYQTDYDVRIRMRSSGGAYYDYSTNAGTTWTTAYTSAYSTESNLHPGWTLHTGTHEFDNARVRKWMATEPTSSFGAVQSALQSPGTYTSQNLDLNQMYAWGDCTGGSCSDVSGAFTANVTVPANTAALFELRHSADGSTGWSSWTTIHNQTSPLTGAITKTRADLVAAIGDTTDRYVQVRITLSSSDGTGNPSVDDYQLDYTTDVDGPSNPTGQNGYSDSGMGTGIVTATWYNYPAPHFTWSGATDADSGMTGGYSGYWVCFGTVSCEPTDGTFVTNAAYTASSLTTNQTYYLRIKARDAAGNVASTAYPAFEYRFDLTNPANPAGVTPDPAGFSSSTTFDFTWSAGSDTGGSGINGYCYKTADPAYAGDTGPGTDTCVGNATFTAVDVPKYKDGANIFYIRSQDVAGNVPSFYTQTQYYYSGSAPTPPQGLSVDPTGVSPDNSFTFSWFAPATYSPGIKGYYYSINQLPQANTTTFVAGTSVGPGAFATQQGTNLFYVVAQDTADNINWDAYASIGFEADTTAPGIPTSVTITDSSIRANAKYLLTVTWNEPAEVGSGIDHYIIERSTSPGCATDPDPDSIFSEYATTSSEGYLDSGLSNMTTYCYRVKAADNAGATSEASSIVSALPEGRYTEPPILIVDPSVQPLIQSATVTWKTDREGSSFVEFGTADTLGRILGQDDFVTDHSVQLLSLSPDTTYYYKVKYTDQDGNIGYSAISTFTTADAPSAPVDLSVSPPSSTNNAFTFTWSPPADAGVEIEGYYYSINATPTSVNSSYTTSTTLGPSPFATRQGTNTFYVVAMDDANNVNYNNFASIEYYASTPAPAIPTGIIITDASNRETEDYSIALKWGKVTIASGGNVTYTVYRSTDNTTFAPIASLQTTGYLDVDLDNTTEYFYYVVASDNAGSTSASSTTVSEIPEGRFTTPPDITRAPAVVPASFSALVSWETNRDADSHIEFGVAEDMGDEQGTIEVSTDHEVKLEGLMPETTYYYRIRSRDEDGNVALSVVSTFTTLEAPTISNASVTDIKLYDAYITWESNLPITTALEYGQTTTYGLLASDTSGILNTNHQMKLQGLTDGTTYHVRMRGLDGEGNLITSDDYSFTTLTFPKVISVSTSNKSQGQTEVTWVTNVPTTSVVEYYNDLIAPKTQGNTAQVTQHTILLFGLEDATTYRFRVRGADQFGYSAASDELSFATLEDTTPPEVFNIQSESNTIGSGETSTIQIVVSWSTDEPTTSQVEYGVGLSGTDFSDSTEENAELVMDHLVVISDLAAAKTYHFRAISRDKAGNASKSSSYTVLTTRTRSSFLQLIINNLEDTFSWLGGVGSIFGG